MGVGKIPLKQLVNDSSMDFSTTKMRQQRQRADPEKNQHQIRQGFHP